jgi:mono/diheme cytochrome c family protein
VKRVLRWLRNALIGVIALALIAAAVIYSLSELALRRSYDPRGTSVAIPADSASIAEGERLARIRGCLGCHRSKLEGGLFIDDPMLARIAAPNLTKAVRVYSDAELEGIIRHGVRPDGRSVVAMPSDMFRVLDDADLGKILAYLHSAPEVPGQARMVKPGPLGRLGIALGKFKPAAEDVRRVETLSDSFPAAGSPVARGAYLARTVCTECHGATLSGFAGETPDLRIAAGYSPEQFVRLMRRGVALGERELGLMGEVARSRFSHFTDEEIEALYAYLLSRAIP